ncbi:hypothetical protein J4449_01625 [Candidatus Woesearchaeota archaeon]|nr:hypothetical protein [Candidatus Woesearchaeota archaeon]
MFKEISFVFFVIVLISGFFFIFLDSGETELNSSSNLQTKTSQSTVSIDLTPQSFNGKEFVVNIGVNTHITDLSRFDLKELAVLEINGKSIKPKSAPKLSGHHNKGALIFDVNKKPEDFKIIVKSFPDLELREFKW